MLKELKEESREDSSLRKILALSMIQDYLIPLGFTIFVEFPTAQIAAGMILMSICLYSVLRHTPFDETSTNILEAGSRALYLLILIMFLINHLVGQNMSEKTRFNYIGFGVIGLVSLLICFNFIILAWVAIGKLRKMFGKEDLEKKGSKNLVQQKKAQNSKLGIDN